MYFPLGIRRGARTYYHLMLLCVIFFATIRENPMRVITERKKAMNTQSDIKMTDQLERELIERELGPRSPAFVDDVKRDRKSVV